MTVIVVLREVEIVPVVISKEKNLLAGGRAHTPPEVDLGVQVGLCASPASRVDQSGHYRMLSLLLLQFQEVNAGIVDITSQDVESGACHHNSWGGSSLVDHIGKLLPSISDSIVVGGLASTLITSH